MLVTSVMLKVLILLSLSVSALDLPDLLSELESPDLKIPMVRQPKAFLPTVGQIQNMDKSESQGRSHWYASAFVSVFFLIMLSGTAIMKFGPMLKERVLGSPSYETLEEDSEEDEVLPKLGVKEQRFFVVRIFGLSLTAVSCSCLWAMMTHRLSKSYGLHWEIYLALFGLVGVGLLIQAVVAVRKLPKGERFSISAFPEACATSMIPTLSDYFDTLKDVIFCTLCLESDNYFIKIMGIASWIYLVAIHVYFVFYRQNCLAELCGTYLPLITVPPAPKGKEESTDGIWSGTLLPLLYKPLAPTKRELLLWENVPQAGFSVIFLLVEGGSLFVSLINLALPAFHFALFSCVRSAMGPQLGKKLNQAMDMKDFVKASHIWEEADFAQDVELFKRALPRMRFLTEVFQVEEMEGAHASTFGPANRARSRSSSSTSTTTDSDEDGKNLNLFVKGVDLILKGVFKSEDLSKVSLSFKNLGDADAEAIAEGLKVNRTVTRLDLEGNNIGDVGAQAIAEGLKANETVTDLDLQNNNIGDVGAQALRVVEKLKQERGEYFRIEFDNQRAP